MREIKMSDTEAVCKLEYDRLLVSGKSFVWSEEAQAVVDTSDNSVCRQPDLR